jgi:hypothetical protein
MVSHSREDILGCQFVSDNQTTFPFGFSSADSRQRRGFPIEFRTTRHYPMCIDVIGTKDGMLNNPLHKKKVIAIFAKTRVSKTTTIKAVG